MFEHKLLNTGSTSCIIWVVEGLKDLVNYLVGITVIAPGRNKKVDGIFNYDLGDLTSRLV